jgi:hypothetical protein
MHWVSPCTEIVSRIVIPVYTTCITIDVLIITMQLRFNVNSLKQEKPKQVKQQHDYISIQV